MNQLTKILPVLLVLISFGCNDEIDQQEPSINYADVFDDIQLGWDPGTTTVDLNQVPLDSLFDWVAAELGDIKERHVGRESNSYDGMEITVKGDMATVTPIRGEASDACGDGDGWKLYGTCYTENCVKDKLQLAADDLGEPSVNECVEFRVKRTLVSAKVCGRKVRC